MPALLRRPPSRARVPSAAPPFRSRRRRRPRLLTGLEVLTGVAAFAGAAFLVGDGMGLDPVLLDRTPFTSWAWPGVALAALVGVPMLLAAAAEWRRTPRASQLSRAAGVVLMGWITGQLALIGYQTWLQPTFFLIGLVVASLASPRATRLP
jgi:hypothetical protein